MNIVLLSGGSGKRLWPLSNDIRSKQFIKLFKNENEYESMVQRVYRQIVEMDGNAKITVATSETQVPAIKNQLGDNVGISIEPCRRDTFPAIALATMYMHDVLGVSEEESVVVCPVDPYVEKDYFEMLKKLSDQADKGEANLVLMGIEPTEPSEKFGYIIPCDKNEISKVDTFKEKPDTETAKSYISQGALWNGGVFAYKLKYLINKAHELIDFTDYEDLFNKYDTLTKISFDYAVAEKETEIQVMRFRGKWEDLGTWNALVDTVEEQTIGNAFLSENCVDTYVVNELNIPVFCMNTKNLVVAAGYDGILISDKDSSGAIKTYVDKIEQPVMYSEEEWGSYKILTSASDNLVKEIEILPNARLEIKDAMHKNIFTVVSGSGKLTTESQQKQYKQGDIFSIDKAQECSIEADVVSKLICVEIL